MGRAREEEEEDNEVYMCRYIKIQSNIFPKGLFFFFLSYISMPEIHTMLKYTGLTTARNYAVTFFDTPHPSPHGKYTSSSFV